MTKLNNISILNRLREENEEIIKFIENEIITLSNEQLQWKPNNKKKWSIIECLDHLNKVAKHYVAEMRKSLMYNKVKNKSHYTPGVIGDFMVKAMTPKKENISYKMNTFRGFMPEKTLDIKSVISTFKDNQQQIIGIINRCAHKDIGKPKVKSYIGNILRFKIGDALRFITAHTNRHILQIRNVISLDSFPIKE